MPSVSVFSRKLYYTFGGTLDDVECMKLTGLARNTYYKYKRQIREEVKTQG